MSSRDRDYKRSPSHNFNQPFWKRLLNGPLSKRVITIRNDSERKIVFIIAYEEKDVVINYNWSIRSFWFNTSGCRKTNTGSRKESAIAVGHKKRKVQVSENEFKVTITSKDEYGTTFVHVENGVMRSHENWYFKQEHIERFVRSERVEPSQPWWQKFMQSNIKINCSLG